MTRMPQRVCCVEKNGVFWRPLPNMVGEIQSIHASCWCNELASLHTRVFPRSPKPDEAAQEAYRRLLHTTAKQLRCKVEVLPWSYERFLESVPSRKRARYAEAVASLRLQSVQRRDARVSMFVKAEKMELREKAGNIVKPRAIQGRTPRYNVSVGVYLKSIESRLYAWKGPKRGGPHSRLIAKGLNSSERAALLERKLACFSKPCVVTSDISAFDAAVRQCHMVGVHGLYLSLMRSAEFQRLLSWQLVNEGCTGCGIRYQTVGKRMSGDMDTALGNCLIATHAIITALSLLGVTKYDLLDDGDDCLVILEQSQVGDGFPAEFRAAMERVGFNSKAEWCGNRSNWCLEDVSFCRSRPVRVNGKYRFIRQLERMVGGFLVSHKHYHEKTSARRVMKSMAQCEHIVGRGVPVMQSLSRHVLELLKHEEFQRTFEQESFAVKASLEVIDLRRGYGDLPVTADTRESFYRAFGMSPDEQVVLEQRLCQLSLDNIDPEFALEGEPDGIPLVGCKLLWGNNELLEHIDGYAMGARCS